MIKSDKTPVILHIPKTGGTSMRNTLGLPRFFGQHELIGRKRMMEFIRSQNDPYVFSFLRCPIDRAISAYHHFSTNILVHDKPPTKLIPVRRVAWTISTLVRMGELDLNKFYRALLQDEYLNMERLSHSVPHFKPQSLWVNRNNDLKSMCHYYDFGRFSEEYQRLLSDIGAKNSPKLKHEMRNKSETDYENSFDSDVEEMLRNYYADDFALLNQNKIPHA